MKLEGLLYDDTDAARNDNLRVAVEGRTFGYRTLRGQNRLDTEADRRVWSATLHLAEHHGLTVYDAAYLEIASRRKIPLATLDRQLRAAAVTEGVQLLAM